MYEGVLWTSGNGLFRFGIFEDFRRDSETEGRGKYDEGARDLRRRNVGVEEKVELGSDDGGTDVC